MTYDPQSWLKSSDDFNSDQLNFGSNNSEKELPLFDDEFMNQRNELLSVEYDPCAPSIDSHESPTIDTFLKEKPDPRKLETYISSLQKMIRPLSSEFKKKLSYDVICQLAHAILDGTVFEIVKGLQDIQFITEKNLYTQRTKLLEEHKMKKIAMLKRHQESIERSQSRPHHILVLERHHADEKKIFYQKCEKEMAQLDQKLLLELDQQVSDQQSTLERAGLPMFYLTNNPDEVRLQMYVLEFISKLIES
ncbi:protein DGCR6 isoform X1 [Hydra vulgaris]|uniref:Protein DGCR6 n=1 Tax=Hydra vulgaris TaxID=6087 RepID=T2MDD0_HYDVU|nr:protein DGCR6 [Hydra vulgaris]